MISATLVFAGHNSLRYLIEANIIGENPPETVLITTSGAATPDLRTDSLQGPIKRAARAVSDGLGQIVPGPMTQAQARALWSSDDSGGVIGNENVSRAVLRFTSRSGNSAVVDANVNAGNPEISVTMGTGTGYLDVECLGTIGA